MNRLAIAIPLAATLILTGCSVRTSTRTNANVNGNVNSNTLPPGGGQVTSTTGTAVAFSSVRQFDIGSLDRQVHSLACVASNSRADLEALISRGGPQSLRELNINFSAKTLVSVYSNYGTSLEVTSVNEVNGTVQVNYRVTTDPQKLLLTVIYNPNEHILIPKTAKPVVCREM